MPAFQIFPDSSMVERVRLRRINRRTFRSTIMFTVYVLRSISSGAIYIGQTNNLERRLQEHQNGIARYTRGRGPWEIIFTEQYGLRREAMAREHFLKSGQGRQWLKEQETLTDKYIPGWDVHVFGVDVRSHCSLAS